MLLPAPILSSGPLPPLKQDLARLLQLGGGQDVAARLADAQRRGRAAHPPNHYAVLGVKPAATPAEVRGAYRALALQYHPDKAAQGGGAGGGLAPEAAQALFRLASEAAQVLGDPEARRAYDLACLRLKYRRFYHAAAA